MPSRFILACIVAATSHGDPFEDGATELPGSKCRPMDGMAWSSLLQASTARDHIKPSGSSQSREPGQLLMASGRRRMWQFNFSFHRPEHAAKRVTKELSSASPDRPWWLAKQPNASSNRSLWLANRYNATANGSKDARRFLETGSDNLCINISGDGEYFAPEFMLIGAEKAATSSFMLLMEAPGIIFGSNYNDSEYAKYGVAKELHIFDRPDRFEMGQAFWLHHFPPCWRDERAVATDFTPTYLLDELAPQRMRSFYAEQSSKVKFGVILRDPLKRMHSAFYFHKNGLGRWLCDREFIDVEFSTYVQGILSGSDPCRVLKAGDYYAQLVQYFKEFDASQFTIFLFQHITYPREDSTSITDLWHSLGLEGSAFEPQPILANENSHPPLLADLDTATLSALKEHITNTMPVSRIAELLSATEQGPTLAEYTGVLDQDSVEAWLEDNW